MQKILRITILFLLVQQLFSACGEEEIELELKGSTTRLVVDGLVTTDTMAHKVRLSLSGDYFHNQPLPGVSGALVRLSDGLASIDLQELAEEPGTYTTPSNYYGKPDHWYTLRISGVDAAGIDPREIFEAQSFIAPLVTPDSIAMEYDRFWELWKILLYCQDPAEVENYYLFHTYLNEKLITDRYAKVSIIDDEFFNGNYANGVWIADLDTREEDQRPKAGDVIKVACYMIDHNYFKYIEAAQIETTPRAPLFSGAPANVPGNISNGALGIFSAASVSRISTVFEP